MVSFILPGNSATGGYEVANSCRFDDASSDYLNRTPSSAGNQRTFTISFWYKRTNFGGNDIIISTSNGSNGFFNVGFIGSGTHADKFFYYYFNGSSDLGYTTNRLFRDVGAWYHIVVAIDTTQGTESNREKLYINGVEETTTATYGAFTQNLDTYFNDDNVHYIGYNHDASSVQLNGYLAEVVNIDGSQLDATSFGEFDNDSPNIWKPKDVSGLTFGTNGFYLDFEDSSSLGNDAAGSNNWTVNNLTSIDQSTDTCTNNFCTLSPLFNFDGSYTLSEGNLKFLGTGGNDGTASTMAVSSGRWYWECEFDGVANTAAAGFSTAELVADIGTSNPLAIFVGVSYFGNSINFNSSGTSGTASDGDIYGFYLDLEAGSGSKTLKIYQNGSLFATETIPTAREGENFIPIVADASSTDSTLIANFGNPILALSSANADANGYGSFEYSPTLSGVNYYAMCTKNLAEFG